MFVPKAQSRAHTGEMTLLLSKINDPKSLATVVRLASHELHAIAVHHFRSEVSGRTLQPTALVNEMWIRFIKRGKGFKNRHYFFKAASETMRHVLVEAARKRRALKRGGDLQRIDFSYAEQIGFEDSHELLDFDAALERLESLHPTWSEVAQLRVFGGLTTPEAAVVLDIGQSTARRRWALARRWLRVALDVRASRADSAAARVSSTAA